MVNADRFLTGKESDADDIQALTGRIGQLTARDRKMVETLVDYCLNEEM